MEDGARVAYSQPLESACNGACGLPDLFETEFLFLPEADNEDPFGTDAVAGVEEEGFVPSAAEITAVDCPPDESVEGTVDGRRGASSTPAAGTAGPYRSFPRGGVSASCAGGVSASCAGAVS